LITENERTWVETLEELKALPAGTKLFAHYTNDPEESPAGGLITGAHKRLTLVAINMDGGISFDSGGDLFTPNRLWEEYEGWIELNQQKEV